LIKLTVDYNLYEGEEQPLFLYSYDSCEKAIFPVYLGKILVPKHLNFVVLEGGTLKLDSVWGMVIENFLDLITGFLFLRGRRTKRSFKF
jgi:hypothetical protein